MEENNKCVDTQTQLHCQKQAIRSLNGDNARDYQILRCIQMHIGIRIFMLRPLPWNTNHSTVRIIMTLMKKMVTLLEFIRRLVTRFPLDANLIEFFPSWFGLPLHYMPHSLSFFLYLSLRGPCL